VRFLVDEQLPPALARWLASRGHDAEHVYDLGLMGMDDVGIARRAIATGSVIVTKDKDYRLCRPDVGPVQVLWLRLGNQPNRALLARLEDVWDAALRELIAGEAIVTVWPAD
jgi:predicted nuclease of predicted toxin-antitoxin system